MNKYKNITKKQLESIYSNTDLSVSKARVLVGMTHKTFVKALRYYGLPVKGRQSKYPQLRDKIWLKKRYIDDQCSIRDIALEIGATLGAVHSALRWLGFELRKSRAGLNIKFPNGRFGSDSSRWKGGIRHHSKGYIQIYSPDHPHTTKEGYVMEHRLVMEKHLGRILDPTEVVNHLNGIKNDNRIENLELVSGGHGEHTKNHFKDSFKLKETEDENNRLRQLLISHGIDPDEQKPIE